MDVKFRQAVNDSDGNFLRWHYWGIINEEFIKPLKGELYFYNTKKKQSYFPRSWRFVNLLDKRGKEIYEGAKITCKSKNDGKEHLVAYFADKGFCGYDPETFVCYNLAKAIKEGEDIRVTGSTEEK